MHFFIDKTIPSMVAIVIMILTVKQAAQILKISDRRVRQLILEGRLPATKFANAWMIKKKDLEKVQDRKPGRPKKRQSLGEGG